MSTSPAAAELTAPRSGPPLLAIRLSIMMFLQYAVWGAWLPIIGRYLGSHLGFAQAEIGLIAGTAGAIGAIFAPFIAGQFADRWFAAERFLSVSMLAGGVVQWILAGTTSQTEWFWLSVVYSIIYLPTLAISTSLTFTHLTDPERQFPPIRVWGTIGWITVSWVFPMVWLQTGLEFQSKPPFLVGTEVADVIPRLADALRLSAILGIAYGLYCLTLPHTPPRRTVESIAFTKAFRLLAKPGLLILTLTALPISLIHTIYFIKMSEFLPTLAGMRDADTTPAMSIGQFSEVFVLAGLGLFVRRIGFKWLLAIGCLAYMTRYFIYSLGTPTEFVVTSIALHGVCYACFYATAFLYVERVAPADVRHSAQTVFAVILFGVGPMLAGPMLGKLSAAATVERTIAECSATVNIIPQKPADLPNEPADAPRGWDKLYAGANADVEAYAKAHEAEKSRAWKALRPQTRVTAFDFTTFWRILSAIAAGSFLIIALLFRPDAKAEPT